MIEVFDIINKDIENFKIRFWKLVDLKDKSDSDCWNWLSIKDKDGYGKIKIRIEKGKFKRFGAHRISYMIHNGKIEGDLCVLHSCDNPTCVNPNHLRLGTHQDNARDKKIRNRQPHPKGILHGGAKINVNDVIRIRSLYKNKNIKLISIAEEFNLTISTITNIATGKDWSHIPGKVKGRYRKINFEIAEEIRKLYATKQYTRKFLANKFNMTVTTITNVINNKEWLRKKT
ncbi:MAG: hypothetical protein UR73_C0010G0003 [candidate division WS6 bacterium GW2011_GWF1_35_23]|uniref:HNH nuclease domain-containing protein n=1 Tax=candidate division WS6 bacterium GW2011_GWF1_35_23 TaxID=1619097 RepID=A0A0G0C7V4_9BACT|nr:MAG: hypothetical protein UR73_C0010G0003 [candidate division WS6 bacterium GW2011_GWF1_35_23]